jgi:hypothetical protein
LCRLAPDQTFAWILTSELSQPSSEARGWQLTRVDASTESAPLEVSARDAPDLEPEDPNDSSHRPIVSYLSDYDADGRPELLFLQEAGQYDPGFAGVVVASSDPPHVLYAPPPGYFIHEAEDVDADGRLDLLLYVIVGGDHDVACGSYYARPDGSFSLSDEGARAAARAWCPRRPTRPSTLEQILCALLWGTPRTSLEAQLRPPLVACELEQGARTGCDPDECDHERERLSLCRFSPPLRLTATRSR